MKSISTVALANLKLLDVRGRDGPQQKEVVMAWDIENARPPTGVPVAEVEKAISNAFQYLQRRKRHAFLAAVSPKSLAAMTSVYGQDQIDYLLSHTDLMLAPGGSKSTSTDAKLLQRIDDFLERQCTLGRASNSVLVLITGDDDYTPRVRRAMDAGMDVELLHPAGITSKNLMATIEGRANVWHADWQQFLDYWIGTHGGGGGGGGVADGGSGKQAAGGSSAAASRGAAGERSNSKDKKDAGGKKDASGAKGSEGGKQGGPPGPSGGGGASSAPAVSKGAASSSTKDVRKQEQGKDKAEGSGKGKGKENGSGKPSAKGGEATGAGPSGRERGTGAQQQPAAAAAVGKAAAATSATAPQQQGGQAAGKAGQQRQQQQPSAPSAARGGDRGKQGAGGASAVLSLSGLQFVRQAESPEGALELVCIWLAEERRGNSAFYQSLHTFVSDCGCKLAVGRDLLADGGELTLTCVDDDERHPQRVVQSARDRLRNEIDEALADAPHVLQPAAAGAIMHDMWFFRMPGLDLDGSGCSHPGLLQAHARQRVPPAGSVEVLRLLLLHYDLCSAPPGYAWPLPDGQVRAAAKALLLVERGLGLPALAMPNGQLLFGQPFEKGEMRYQNLEVAAIAAMLRSRLDPFKLQALLEKHAAAVQEQFGSDHVVRLAAVLRSRCCGDDKPQEVAPAAAAAAAAAAVAVAAPAPAPAATAPTSPAAATAEALQQLLLHRGLCSAPPGYAWPLPDEQVRAAAKALLLVERGLGLPPLALPNGQHFFVQPFEQDATRYPKLEKAAIAAMLRSRLAHHELQALLTKHAAAMQEKRSSDQVVRLAAVLRSQHCDDKPPQEVAPTAAAAPAPAPAAAAATSPAAASAGSAGATDVGAAGGDNSKAATPATGSGTAAAAAPNAPVSTATPTTLAALSYPKLQALLSQHGHDASVMNDPQLYGTAFALLGLEALEQRKQDGGGTAASGAAASAATAGSPGGGGGGAGPLVVKLPDGTLVRPVLPSAFVGVPSARAAVAQVLGSRLSCGALVAMLRGLGGTAVPGAEKIEVAALLADRVIAAAAQA
ncbi:hypothetical protein HXX76_014432 [Chlamydomonas incerta]|uniref:NYN domain-containing protein n=1 Tax=Chlamydomonas incerta TaxID=51695 RepID=A0A835SRF3_CHLIN|nr:hypothetical protein HXX76_014432 [Chlamydomonas incerta]|eukprot:KAG2424551.1 hypothetical protein HXX76_014432 [Chlamydomonas incerta]